MHEPEGCGHVARAEGKVALQVVVDESVGDVEGAELERHGGRSRHVLCGLGGSGGLGPTARGASSSLRLRACAGRSVRMRRPRFDEGAAVVQGDDR